MKESTKELVGLNLEELIAIIGCCLITIVIYLKLDLIIVNLVSILGIGLISYAIYMKYKKGNTSWRKLNIITYITFLIIFVLVVLVHNFLSFIIPS